MYMEVTRGIYRKQAKKEFYKRTKSFCSIAQCDRHEVSVWQKLFLPTYFIIQLIFATIYESHCIFDTIHGFHCTILDNFYLYLQ